MNLAKIAYIYEDDLFELNVAYNQVLMKDFNTKDKSLKEKFTLYSDRIKNLKVKRKNLIKVSKKAEEYYAAHPLPYSKEDIIGTYQIMELEFDHTYRLSNYYDDNDYNNYVDVKELPRYAREEDVVVLVQDKETKQKKYYFTRLDYEGSYDSYLDLMETKLNGIKERKVGAACLDVYEEESDLFYEDKSNHIINDDILLQLIAMPNVLVTSHQAFLTNEALNNIADTTTQNLLDHFENVFNNNEVCYRCGKEQECKKIRKQKCF